MVAFLLTAKNIVIAVIGKVLFILLIIVCLLSSVTSTKKLQIVKNVRHPRIVFMIAQKRLATL